MPLSLLETMPPDNDLSYPLTFHGLIKSQPLTNNSPVLIVNEQEFYGSGRLYRYGYKFKQYNKEPHIFKVRGSCISCFENN